MKLKLENKGGISLVQETLADGSLDYEVQVQDFYDNTVVLACHDESGARELFEVLNRTISHVTIDN